MNKNTIPPITDPMGKYWEQPELKNILIDSEYAVMSASTFLQLKTYNSTIPNGVYEGKMWKCEYWDCEPKGSMLAWYQDNGMQDDAGRKIMSIEYREILILS